MTNTDIQALCDAHPLYIPVNVAAKFLHVKPDGLRASIDQGRCPFGFSWTLGTRSGYKIPTITFVSWLIKGSIPFPSA
jgi:hypothetical protein